MDTQKKRTTNRRASQRRASRPSARVKCHLGPMFLGRNILKSLVNISETGLQFVCVQELLKGMELEFLITSPGNGKEIKRIADVAWCQPNADTETYLVGVHFRRILSYNDLLSLGQGIATMR